MALIDKAAPSDNIDLEGMVLDSKRLNLTLVRDMYFSPERELVENAIKLSQRQVKGKVNLVAYKLRAIRLEKYGARKLKGGEPLARV
ncbi:hypothetical protein DER46DRAFT_660016 [Fusarium sp. MPI-SDFR-AT-0072]|nr:hypothetical protein DER46DRAFT_660016 [Fusarium sp. MPI-SDFR-AT-0072]